MSIFSNLLGPSLRGKVLAQMNYVELCLTTWELPSTTDLRIDHNSNPTTLGFRVEVLRNVSSLYISGDPSP